MTKNRVFVGITALIVGLIVSMTENPTETFPKILQCVLQHVTLQ